MLTSFLNESFDGAKAELYLLELPMKASLQAAHGSTTYRQLTVVSIETSAGKGWGECSALTSATYGTASAAQCFEQLRSMLPHSFAAQTYSEALTILRSNVDPLAYAAVEMAALDLALHTENISLKQWLGATKNFVKAGAVLGLPADSQSLQSQIEKTVAEGYKRIKVKITPQTDLAVFKAITTEHNNVEVHVDPNGSFERHHSDELRKLFDIGVTAIEQPFPPIDRQSAQALTTYATKHHRFVVADEAADSLASIRQIAQNEIANAISVKSSRLGGLLATQAVQQHCLSHGLAMSAGGMLESGLGRTALSVLAACDGFTLTGDVSPASRWLQKDPWQDSALIDGKIEVPDSVGITPPPDKKILNAVTKQHWAMI